MLARRDLAALAVAACAAATAVAILAGGRAGELLFATAGLALPALFLLAGGPTRPRWLRWVHWALAADLVATGLWLLALRGRPAAPEFLPILVQLAGFWLLPFLLTATAALAARKRDPVAGKRDPSARARR